MIQDTDSVANTVVARGASNVLWAWERGQVTGDEAMESIQRLFERYRDLYRL